MRWSVLSCLVALACACTAPKSKRCREVCAREAECIGDKSAEGSTFDEGECVAACAALESDTETKPLVIDHADCVHKAGKDCAAVHDCH